MIFRNRLKSTQVTWSLQVGTSKSRLDLTWKSRLDLTNRGNTTPQPSTSHAPPPAFVLENQSFPINGQPDPPKFDYNFTFTKTHRTCSTPSPLPSSLRYGLSRRLYSISSAV